MSTSIRILDVNGNEIYNPDLTIGHLANDALLIKHHDEIPAISEQFHYEVVAEYISGGQDVVKVVDKPEVPAIPAWDEYEPILRYIEYTPDEIAALNKPTDIETLQSDIAYLAMKTGNTEVLKDV